MAKRICKLPIIGISSVTMKLSSCRAVVSRSYSSFIRKSMSSSTLITPVAAKRMIASTESSRIVPSQFQRSFWRSSTLLQTYVAPNPAPKKRVFKRKFIHEANTFPVVAFATCEELDLEELHKGLIEQDLYIPSKLSDDMDNVIHTTAKYKIGPEPREIFFFREGAVVFWNMSELERNNVITFLKDYEDESYDEKTVLKEFEYMVYAYQEQGNTRLNNKKFMFNPESANTIMEKYAFANALALSVKLGIWESTLENFVDGIEHITSELKRAEHIRLTRAQVLQKTGELFALRHQLNLNSDLLDTPDFYWERERLETLYQKTRNHLSITRRTNVMNEKLSQCCALLDLITNHLNDEHHTRLEWMIIVLIMIEVGFEILHVAERYDILPILSHSTT